MSSHPRRTIGSILGIGLVSGAFIWGGQSLTMSSASTALSQGTPAGSVGSPAPGFTDVAKRVTPVVVNITTVMTEHVDDGSPVPDELRE